MSYYLRDIQYKYYNVTNTSYLPAFKWYKLLDYEAMDYRTIQVSWEVKFNNS